MLAHRLSSMVDGNLARVRSCHQYAQVCMDMYAAASAAECNTRRYPNRLGVVGANVAMSVTRGAGTTIAGASWMRRRTVADQGRGRQKGRSAAVRESAGFMAPVMLFVAATQADIPGLMQGDPFLILHFGPEGGTLGDLIGRVVAWEPRFDVTRGVRASSDEGDGELRSCRA